MTLSPARRWALLLAASGAVALAYEIVWLRRVSLFLGGSHVAAAVTVAAFMGGLAAGAALAPRLRGDAVRWVALCEGFAALWALAFPLLLLVGQPVLTAGPAARFALAVLLLLPPATALGATWPLLARTAGADTSALLYAANTAGAVLGVLAATLIGLPLLGVRGTETTAAVAGLCIAAIAWALRAPPGGADASQTGPQRAGLGILMVAAGLSGAAALGLEVVWFRLAAVALGATVQTNGWVLAVFLAAVATGALAGRTWPADPRSGLIAGLAATAALALAGAQIWGQLPLWMGAAYRMGGPEAMLPASTALAAVAMGGAPVASGFAFSCAVRALGPALPAGAGPLLAANTLGGIAGAALGGLWAIPVLEIRGAVWLFAGCAALGAVLLSRRPWPALPALALALLVPQWDARLYAVGVHLRVSDFADPSRATLRDFADDGWDLLAYDHGATGAVAVGRSRRSGNTWLSINGKVDASTGEDMPTQLLSAQLPLALAHRADRVLVVGLASGVTAGQALRDPRVTSLTVAELEPAVIAASRFFDDVSGAPLDDPRTRLVVDDARAWLTANPAPFDVVISEPSNPWISGVSSLFTLEYWRLVRAHLGPQGVACQWIQLYGMGPDELRGLLRTFLEVFPNAMLFETIAGSDILLVGGDLRANDRLALAPLLRGDALHAVAGTGWLNTDDRPRVEFAAPRWLHYDTGPANAALLRATTAPPPPATLRSVPRRSGDPATP